MNRRNFIKSTCLNCAGVLGASMLLQNCTSHKYITTVSGVGNKLSIKKSEFLFQKKEKIMQRKFVLIKPDNLQFPIALYKLNENEYRALYLQCTHQGCELSAYDTVMVCPCHGAEFNASGEVTNGPAEINLKMFSTSSDNETIYIQL